MRLWSISPEYLDRKGLISLWREALLAKKVLCGKTRGYKNHPQLIRFKTTANPVKYINTYLYYIYKESKKRGFNFNKKKCRFYKLKKLCVSNKQIQYEFMHLLRKLKKRDEVLFKMLYNEKNIISHSLFKVITGNIESWEKQKEK